MSLIFSINQEQKSPSLALYSQNNCPPEPKPTVSAKQSFSPVNSSTHQIDTSCSFSCQNKSSS